MSSRPIEIEVHQYPDKYPCVVMERDDWGNEHAPFVRLLRNDDDFDAIINYGRYDDPIIVYDEKTIEENKDYHYVLGTDNIFEEGHFCCEICSGYDSGFDRAETGAYNNVDCDGCQYTMYCHCRQRYQPFTSVGQLPKDPGNQKLW